MWCLTYLVAIVSVACAFTTTRVAAWNREWTRSLCTKIRLSDKGDGDEVSKLIGKRDQINRRRKEDIQTEKRLEKLEPVVDLDLDNLPKFTAERPLRGVKIDETNELQGEDKTTSSDSPIVDFMAEYDDENDFHIPNRIGISTRCWGDSSRNFLSGGKLTKRMVKLGKFVPGDVQLAHSKLLEGGITFFDTAPTYGATSLNQELSAAQILHRCLKERREDLPEGIISVQLGQSPWTKIVRPSAALVVPLEKTLERLKTDSVELYSIPKPVGFPSTFVANALYNAIESGQCLYVGVSGITSPRSLAKLRNKLEAKDVVLTANTFEYSLTNRKNEAMIDACKALGIIPLITNPLDDGLASGVYTATNPSGGQAIAGTPSSGNDGKFSFKKLEKLQPLHSVQETLTERVANRVRRESQATKERFRVKYGPAPKINTDITTTQIAIHYIIAKGGVPLVEVNTPKQAEEVLGCLGWSLTDEEVDMLNAASDLSGLK
jgi:aryl-alcohol dehydrogenase-like predicted oxidoreductase